MRLDAARLTGTAPIRVPDLPYLGLLEVAALFGVHPKTIKRWVARGDLPVPRRINGRIRWTGMQIGIYVAFTEHCRFKKQKTLSGHTPDTSGTKPDKRPRPA